jgi:glycosyltransferase involved in cell wall biosynthesis
MAAPALSVVVPAYNEVAGIAATLSSLHATVDRLGMSREILVVDNASTDGTGDLVEALADPRVRLLRNRENLGKGASLRRGMLEATGALRLHCDADCGPSVDAFEHMVALSERFDVVVGSRLAPGARVGRRQPVRRRIAGRSFGLLCRALLREPTRDLFCGFKLWRAPAAVAVYRATAVTGWTFDAETLAMARALGYSITETGIPWTDREGSRLSMPRVIVPVTRELLDARGRVLQAARAARAAPGQPAAELVEAAEPRA